MKCDVSLLFLVSNDVSTEVPYTDSYIAKKLCHHNITLVTYTVCD